MQPSRGDVQSVSETEAITYGPLVIDAAGFAVTIHDHVVPLTYSEFLLLSELAHHPNLCLDRDTLFQVLTQRDSENGRDSGPKALSVRAVDLHISRLRKKMKRAGCDCVRTMRFVGYRFVPPAE